jgi:selenocysteine lyase/cysteine desulfurase
VPDPLRSEFPVLERLSYLNAGTNGPAPRRGVEAARAALAEQAESGRGDDAYVEAAVTRFEKLRRRAARLLGCEPGELAITGSTTDGVNTVLSALDLGPGDEVLTSDEEHPGVLVPLAAGRARRGFDVRVAPLEELAGAVGPRTRLVACSHVSWHTGRVVDAAELAATGVQVLLDGAQGLGAVPVDVRELGCDFYAASGQKWLCGPNGLGYLFVRGERIAELPPPWPGFGALADPARPLDFDLHDEARRFDTLGFPAPHQAAWALAALDVLEGYGIGRAHARALGLASHLAAALADRGLRVAPRGHSTLVSWEVDDPKEAVGRLRERDVIVRDLPGSPYVRASVGAWNGEEELDRLAELAAGR